MEYLLPQEIQVRYILPAIRGELARALVDEGLSQKEAARMLKITEAAISQYLSSKRGNNVQLSRELKDEIKMAARRIRQDNSILVNELVKLANHEKAIEAMCLMHKISDKTIEDRCRLCFDNKEIVK